MGPQLRRHWPLWVILCLQALLSLPFILTRAAFGDEAFYRWTGWVEIQHWLHHHPALPPASAYSGAPVFYPPLDALTGSLTGGRVLSLAFMLAATALLYFTALRLAGSLSAVAATALFALSASVIHLGSYATYDGMALFLLAVAGYAAIRTRESYDWVALSAAALIMASVAKYASMLWVPIVIGMVLLTCWETGAREAVQRSLAVGMGWALGMGIFLLIGGHLYSAGLFQTTLSRRSGVTPALDVLGYSLRWEGLIIVLAILCCAGALIRRETWAPLAALLAIAGMLAPMEEARIHTLISLSKHAGYGAWFAAIPAGFAVSAGIHWVAGHRPSLQLPSQAIAAIVLVPVTVVAVIIADGYRVNEPPVGRIMPTLERLQLSIGRGKIITDIPIVARTVPPIASPWRRWLVLRHPDGSAFELIQNAKAALVVLGFGWQFRSMDSRYEELLHASKAYTLVASAPYTRDGHPCEIWERVG